MELEEYEKQLFKKLKEAIRVEEQGSGESSSTFLASQYENQLFEKFKQVMHAEGAKRLQSSEESTTKFLAGESHGLHGRCKGLATRD